MLFGGSRSGGGVLGTTDPGRPPALNALQRRAQQLKKWQEHEEQLSALEASKNNSSNNGTGNIKKPRIPKVKFSNKTLFLAACANGDLEEAQRLLANGTDINCVNIDGLTGMHQACIDDNLNIVTFLIENGADVNACDNDGWTPLHAAANCGHYEIVEALLQAGADATIINNDGELASDIADTDSVKELINSYLLNQGNCQVQNNNLDELRKQELTIMTRDVNQWINSGKFVDKLHPRTGASFLHVAASKGYTSVISSLLNCTKLKSQVEVDVRDKENWTPLMAAVYWQQVPVVELLLQHGADPFVRTTTGQSLEELSDNKDIIELIQLQKKKLQEEAEKAKEAAAAASASSPAINNSNPSTPSISSGNTSLSSTLLGTPTESETQRKAHAKRVRETRRSTQGISAEDISKAKDHIQQQQQQQQASNVNNNNNNTTSSTSTPSSTLNTVPGTNAITSTSPSTQATATITTSSTTTSTSSSSYNASQQLPTQASSKGGIVTCTNVKDSVNGSTCDADQPDSSSVVTHGSKVSTGSSLGSDLHVTSTTKDYQKLYEEVLESIEVLKKQHATKEVEWSRERRLLQRKISEMEEELKNIDILKSDNQRLKDENGALIRVISKLSK